MGISRRNFILHASVAGGALLAGTLIARRPAGAVHVAELPHFVDPLPLPANAAPVGTTRRRPYPRAPLYRIAAGEVRHRFHRDLPETTVWGYGGSFPGPTIRATAARPIYVEWVNQLGDSPHPLWWDTFAAAHTPELPEGTPASVRRIVTHLHGARVPEDSDGWPEELVLPGQRSRPYFYPNVQEAATLWYHDHALGITRLNVMMGLAGFYILSDPYEQALPLPKGAYDLPLAIQDRWLTGAGAVSYNSEIVPEFFGDMIIVNGKAWPYHDVDRGKYRLRLLNGCNSRFLDLRFHDGREFQQIASEQGLLPGPVAMPSIRLAPGERAEIVVDFSGDYSGNRIRMVNFAAPTPYPGDGPLEAPEDVMEFRVGSALGHRVAVPPVLRRVIAGAPNVTRPTSSQFVESMNATMATAVRSFTLDELVPAEGQTGICTNTGGFSAVITDSNGGFLWDDPLPFKVRFGATEIWEFTNNTVDSHPIHMHLVQMQLLERIPPAEGTPPVGNAEGPGIWKDTYQVHPGETIRLIGRFDGFRGRFPFHCHILEHEDCEMMRFFEIANPTV